ncbi:penicillin-insensitive murein endopeptidase [Vibrio sp. WXL103]|uniref:penicillin-insensitive murein endopeptidase n=1 Tax=unclassified Vibrio TaxID=2614977 RepID=UPI003EC4BC83
MDKRASGWLLVFSAFMSLLFFASYSNASPWELAISPTSDPAQSIGTYANGCVIGAKALPVDGEGYQVLRSQMRRNFAHPEAVGFVESLAKQVYAQTQLSLLVGDMSLPRGGQFSSGHTSHQTGLDIDIWLQMNAKPWQQEQLASPQPVSLVDLDYYTIQSEHWQPSHLTLFRTAANSKQVARIFVHPVIKKQLCLEAGEDKDWLRKVRPWWGHHYHMHVRLHCPEGSHNCRAQRPPPQGSGCGAELDSWFPQSVPVVRPKSTAKKDPKRGYKKIMPPQCQALIAGN